MFGVCLWVCLGCAGCAWVCLGVLGGAKLSCQTFMVDEGEEEEEEEEEDKSALIDHRLSPMVK